MKALKNARRRRRSAGAAMIEAAVVMCCIVATWGAMATAYTNGSAKLGAQWQARSSTMYYASNECKKKMTGGAASKSVSGSIDQRSGNAQGDRAANGAPLGESLQQKQFMFMASGSGTGSANMGRWSANKSSSSWAVCNEGKYAGDLFGLLAYGADFFHDLLPGPIQAMF